MQYTISHRMSDVHGSAIRELFKLGADPNMISFGGGNPSAETFPVPEIAEIMADVMKNAPVSVLQYGLSEGYTPLRDTMKEYLARTQGFDFEKNELFIVSGGQQCADLTTKVLVNEGDVILTEDPAFVGCLNTFRSYGAKLVGVPMQQDGMDIDALEAALKANPNAKLLYTIPSFQNPSGITTTLEKRKKVYELACKYDIAILEDNPYGELRFSGEDVPTIKSMDTEGRVLYAGSFSKVMAPAFRLGFLVFNKSLTMPLTITAPPVISRSRICSCPVASTMRFISGQYSGMAVSSASSCVAVARPSTSNHVKSRHFSSKSILYHPLISPWLRASYESGVRFIPPRRKRPAAAPAESAAASRQ